MPAATRWAAACGDRPGLGWAGAGAAWATARAAASRTALLADPDAARLLPAPACRPHAPPPPLPDAPQISAERRKLAALGADPRLMGIWVENHDTPRFLSVRCADQLKGDQALGWPARLPPQPPPPPRLLRGCPQARPPAPAGGPWPRARCLPSRAPTCLARARRPDLAAYRNALAYNLLSESIPIM